MTPRKSFRGPGSGWSPPTYTVADDLKVTGGYVPQGVNNWGRWGPDDQLGTRNFIGDEQVRYATTRSPADRYGDICCAALASLPVQRQRLCARPQ